MNSAEQAGLPDTLIYPNRYDFGPRAGFAYRLGGQNQATVLRGGYPIYAYPEQLRAITCETRAIVPTTATFSNNPNSAQQSPDGLPNYLLRSVPTVVAGVNSKDVLDLNTVPADHPRAPELSITSIPTSPPRAPTSGTSPSSARS